MSRLSFLCLVQLLAVSCTCAFVSQRPPTFAARAAPTTTTSSSSSALNVAINTAEIKNGLTVEIDGEPYKVVSFSIMKQARGAAKTTIKFKNLMKGTTIENTYRSGEKFETAMIEKKQAQFTYMEGINYFFMDSITFEELAADENVVGDRAVWLTEGSEVTLVDFKGKIIEVLVPSPGEYEVVETEPNVKGNTAQGHTKPATLSCGAVINVPGFVEQGQVIRVDVDKGAYMERVQ